MKDWIVVVLLAAMALGLFGFAGFQGLIWDRAYNQALSKYREAYAHRDDPGKANTFSSFQDYDETEKRLESLRTEDAERLQKFKDLHACGLSLKGYHDLKVNGFGTAPFEKASAACALPED